MPPTTRRIAAILVADVVGYSRLIERDESRVLSTMRTLRTQVLEPLLAQHQGRIVKLMGDGALIEFASVVDAVQCAIAIQRTVAKHQASAPPDRRIVFRIGVNLGDVVVEGHDLLGDGVNIAARLEQLCEPGNVLISGTAYDQLHGKVDIPFQFVGEQKIKNIERKVRAYRIQLNGSARARFTRPQMWVAGAALGILLVVAATAGLGWWMLGGGDELFPSETAEVDPLEALAAEQGPAPVLQSNGAAQPLPGAASTPAAPAPTPQAVEPAAAPATQPSFETAPTAPASQIFPQAAPQAPPIPAAADRVAELRTFISGYDGGPCFFASPEEVTERSASIEAFAASLPAVEALDESFRQASAFEAQIGLRQVTPAQCPAVDFLRSPAVDPGATPGLEVQSLILENGQSLLGAVTESGDRRVAILLVEDDGTVHDISDTIRRTPDRLHFEVQLTSSAAGAAKPLLLMAVASPNPLAALADQPLPPASRLFPMLADEARLSGGAVGVALKYLRLEG